MWSIFIWTVEAAGIWTFMKCINAEYKVFYFDILSISGYKFVYLGLSSTFGIVMESDYLEYLINLICFGFCLVFVDKSLSNLLPKNTLAETV